MCVMGTVGIVSFGICTYFSTADLLVKQQVGENVYVFRCKEHDRLEKTCDTKQHLEGVYEHATLETIAYAPVSWITFQNRFLSKDEWCSEDSYHLEQCYNLEPERERLYKQYLEEKVK